MPKCNSKLPVLSWYHLKYYVFVFSFLILFKMSDTFGFWISDRCVLQSVSQRFFGRDNVILMLWKLSYPWRVPLYVFRKVWLLMSVGWYKFFKSYITVLCCGLRLKYLCLFWAVWLFLGFFQTLSFLFWWGLWLVVDSTLLVLCRVVGYTVLESHDGC